MDIRPVSLLVVGAGDRGALFARLSRSLATPARIVAVAEPRKAHRDRLGDAHDVPEARRFDDWSHAAAAGRLADAVIIATPDHVHTAPALELIEQGYSVLLEKPMAPTAAECRAIASAALEAGVILGVGHVLRYSDFTRQLKSMVDDGIIGDVMAIQRLEPIGYFHFAHSYVRGNWRREDESSFTLLTKSCHDLDWLRYIVGRPCRQVSSFGTLRHFRASERPAEAAERCLDCPLDPACPYSARRIYLTPVERGDRGWPVSVVTTNPTPDTVARALRKGPFGRCVYTSDNDVVETQVVNLAFEGGCLATFILTAFTPFEERRTTIFGSLGQLRGDGRYIEHFDFLTEETTEIDTRIADCSGRRLHEDGDKRLLEAFLRAVALGDPRAILSGPRETLESHLMVFAAERSRLENRVVDISTFRE